jgi:hypothetical protein
VEKQPTREEKRRLHKQAREHYQQDWLAPFGSPEEKQLLRILQKRGRLSHDESKLIDEWLKDPEAIKRGRDPLFVNVAKQKYLGEVIWETAAQRHKQLDDAEWLVAYFTTLGKTQKRLATLMHLSMSGVDQIMIRIKQKIGKEYGYSIDIGVIAQVTRWFLGQ